MDGSDPPFFLPGAGAGVWRHSHLRHTPWGGRSHPIDPCGKARNDTIGVTGLSLMSARNGNLKLSLSADQGALQSPLKSSALQTQGFGGVTT